MSDPGDEPDGDEADSEASGRSGAHGRAEVPIRPFTTGSTGPYLVVPTGRAAPSRRGTPPDGEAEEAP